jgi:hypothetical protein
VSPLSWMHRQINSSRPARTSARNFRPQVRTLEDRDLPSFAAPLAYPVAQPLAVVAADVNGDGWPDLIALAGNGGSVSVQLNNKKGGFGAAQPYGPGGLAPVTMAVGDVNGDGKPDIVLANTTNPGDPSTGGTYTGCVYILQGDGKGGFTGRRDPVSGRPEIQPVFPGPVTSIARADVDGDGRMDLVGLSTGLGNQIYVARSIWTSAYSARTYSVQGSYPTYGQCQLAVADVNGDGRPDVVVTSPMGSSVSVLLNSGGTFGAVQSYAVAGVPAAVAIGDVSGDGKADIVTANANGTVSVLLGQGDGSFGAAQIYAVGGPANSVALGDFNHDGRLDIATTGGTEADVLRNNGSGTFGGYQKVGPAGSSIVAADLNGDGYPDLVQIDGSNAGVDVLVDKSDW